MRIYLDHNATTPLRPEVVDAMIPCLRDGFGNPSSTYAEGVAARAQVEAARAQVAAAVGAEPSEVIFTAGATEANNTVLAGLVARSTEASPHLVISSVEHPSVLEPSTVLAERGARLTTVAVDEDGRLDLDAYRAAVAVPGTALASVIFANNETGVLQDVARLAEISHEAGVLLHIDATQALGKIPIDLRVLQADFLSCSAHKLNGPKGVGCLVSRAGRALPPLLAGGPQEMRRRGGTENTASIVGFGVACALAHAEAEERGRRYAELRDRLWAGLSAKIEGVRRNGSGEHVLPNTLNVEFSGAAGEVLLQAMDLEGVAASAGAACHSGAISPSHVLTAMGRSPEESRSTLRLSVGHGNDEAQVDRVIGLLGELVGPAREAFAT